MRIKSDTRVTDIFMNHEKRIGTLELALLTFLAAELFKQILHVLTDKINNVADNV